MDTLRITPLIGLLLSSIRMLAQPESPPQRLTLDQCYEAARTQYPLLKQKSVLQQTGDLAVARLNTNRQLPQIALNGQATWQSDVTKIPLDLPNVNLPTLSKDQYKLTADISYALYDGNLTRLQIDQQRAQTATAQQQVEIELRGLKDQVNGLFMNALLTDDNLELTQTQRNDLLNRIEKLKAGVRFGTAAQTNVDVLQAEVLRNEQRLAELNASRRGLRDALHLLTNLPVGDSTRLVVDLPNAPVSSLILNRPELQFYKTQRALFDAQLRLADNAAKPRLSLFAQPGVGRPGLNLLNNDFRAFFLGGLRLNWNISAAYTIRNTQETVRLNQQTADLQQAAFEQNLAVQLRQQQTDIDRIEAQISRDADIVALRERIRRASAVQLDNGVIAARDYATELDNETQARLNQKLHERQRLLALIQYRTLSGN
jgi:outer membrane protein TolC